MTPRSTGLADSKSRATAAGGQPVRTMAPRPTNDRGLESPHLGVHHPRILAPTPVTLHTRRVRPVSIIALALALATGRADAKPAATDEPDFWREIIEPHAHIVSALVTRARLALGKP